METNTLSVNRHVSPNDNMWTTGKDYFSVGESGLAAVKAVLSLSRKRDVQTILDLPSGWGRVGRYLRAAFPAAQITFCDIETEGTEFCAREFGGDAFYSKPELSKLVLPYSYDVIWVGSLFTHVDYDRTKRWLEHLCSFLSPDGVLVATFHGNSSIEVQKTHPMIDPASWQKIVHEYENAGYGYAPYETIEGLGISLCKPSKIVEVVEGIPGIRLLSYMERGWADNHDVLGVAKTDRLVEPW